MKKSLGQTALLVVDMQQGLFRKPTRVWQAERLLANINILIERAHAGRGIVVYVQYASDKVLPRGSVDWQLHPQLDAPLAGDLLVEKQHGNAFEKTDLAARLDACKVGRVVVTGLVTHGCVKATCLGALELDYEVVLAGDAHSSYSQDAAALVDQWNAKISAAGASVELSAAIHLTASEPAAVVASG